VHTLLFRPELFIPLGCAGEKSSRTSRPKLKSGSYIARSIKMSINPRRYRCLLLLLAFFPSLPHSTPISRCLIYLFFLCPFFLSLGASFAGVPGKRIVDLDLVGDTPRFSTPVLHRNISLFDVSTFFAISNQPLFQVVEFERTENFMKSEIKCHIIILKSILYTNTMLDFFQLKYYNWLCIKSFNN